MESKNLFDLKYGDVIRALYGDFDNWISAVFESFTIDDSGINITWHEIGKTKKRVMCSFHCRNGIYYDVIGTEQDFIKSTT